MKKLSVLLLFLAAAVAVCVSGCSKETQSNIDQFISASGRDYGESKSAGIGETLTCQFFSMKVNEAYKMTSVSGYTPNDENKEFLCVNVTVTSVFDEKINVGAYDFDIRWGDGENDTDVAVEQDDFGYDCYPSEKDITKGASVTGNVYFMVPKDAPELTFEYLEIYEDDFNGNTYQVNLGNSLEYKEDPDAPKPVGNYQTAVGDVSETSFFDMTVTDTYRTDSVKGYTCDEGFEFLAVTVDIVNTMDDVIPVGVSDFTVSWGSAGDDEWDYAVEDENVVSFPIEQSLAAGQEVYGDVYFVVPKNAENFTFNYVEYFADGTTGSSYTIPLDIPEFRANFA